MLITLAASLVLSLITAFTLTRLSATSISKFWRTSWLVFCGVLSICSALLAVYIIYYLAVPSQNMPHEVQLDGIELIQIIQTEDARAVAHVAKLDLSKTELTLTPPDPDDPRHRYRAMTTSSALLHHGGLLAVNASFFTPFRDRHLFDYYPRSGDKVEAIGKTIVHGRAFGIHGNNWPTLVVYTHRIDIEVPGIAVTRLAEDHPVTAVSGKSMLVENGVNVAEFAGSSYPRTAVGIDATGSTLWLVVVDGKQPLYSRGIRLRQLADMMVRLGVHRALELDGGGSSTMAARVGDRVRVLNRPSHTNLPARERPVANHLIVRARSVYEL